MILYNEQRQLFCIHTNSSSYIMQVGADRQLHHIYYGAALKEVPSFLYDRAPYRRAQSVENVDADSVKCSREYFHYECPTYGMSDFRIPALHGVNADGSRTVDLRYVCFEIKDSCEPLDGLPSVHGTNAQSLIIYLEDPVTHLKAALTYRVFEDSDVITRSISLENAGNGAFHINEIMSACVDFENGDFDMLTFGGTTLREFTRELRPLAPGITEVTSTRGTSSHQHHPIAALMRKNTSESHGEVYGISLLYSGNFTLRTEIDPFGSCRLQAGINPFCFDWTLEKGARFDSPECALVWTDQGLNGLSNRMHSFMRRHVLPERWAMQERPVLLNTWEGCFFDVSEEKLLGIGNTAAALGIKLLVLDDGWFGKRNAADSSLGDWTVNADKFPDGLDALSKKLPIRLGLWFEPEMISPDSELYRQHPDWCLHTDGRVRTEWRNQLVLDMSRDDVIEYLKTAMDRILESGSVSFIKWDHNRRLTQVRSALLALDRQGEVFHRYVLGLYRLLSHIRTKYPELLVENCASGGGRYDWGMYCYFDQGWLSDNTDAVCRLELQSAASVFFPPEVITSHISVSPNQQVERATPWNFRRDVCALFNAGYELDIHAQDENDVKTASHLFDSIGKMRSHAGFYRLSGMDDTSRHVWELSDDSGAVIGFFMPYCKAEPSYWTVYPEGLEENANYRDERTGEVLSGATWMRAGVRPAWRNGDFVSEIITLTKV